MQLPPARSSCGRLKTFRRVPHSLALSQARADPNLPQRQIGLGLTHIVCVQVFGNRLGGLLWIGAARETLLGAIPVRSASRSGQRERLAEDPKAAGIVRPLDARGRLLWHAEKATRRRGKISSVGQNDKC